MPAGSRRYEKKADPSRWARVPGAPAAALGMTTKSNPALSRRGGNTECSRLLLE